MAMLPREIKEEKVDPAIHDSATDNCSENPV